MALTPETSYEKSILNFLLLIKLVALRSADALPALRSLEGEAGTPETWHLKHR